MYLYNILFFSFLLKEIMKAWLKKLFSWVLVLMIIASQSPLGSLLGTVGTASAADYSTMDTLFTVTSPNGGETWNGTKAITWTTTSASTGVDIWYCVGADCGNANYTPIATDQANNWLYNWNTTTAWGDSTQYKVRVSLPWGSNGDISDAVFTVDNTAPAWWSFTINNGDIYTSSTSVTLNTTCAVDWLIWWVQVAFWNTASPTNRQSCTTSLSHTLTAWDASKTVYMRFKDSLWNTTSDTTDTITLDASAPTVNVGADISASGTVTITPTSINWAIAWIKSYLRVNEDSLQGTWTYVGGVTNANLTVSNFTPDWTYTLGLLVTDNAGNTGYDTLEFTWDTTAPTINISNPGSSPAKNKTVTASISDGTLTMTAWSGNSTCNATRTFIAYASTTFSSESDNGKYICYKAVDALWNTRYLLSDQIAWIDTTAPTFSSKSTFSSNWYNTNQTSTFTYTDNVWIVSWTPVTCTISTEWTTSTCSVTPNVCDAAGNCNTTLVTSNAIKLDKTAPAFSSKSSFEWRYGSTQTSTFTYTDILSTISWSNTATCTITEWSSSTCSVTPNICDVAWNCNTTQITSNWADVDLTAPVVTLTALSPDPTNNNTVTFNGNASDNLTNIVSVEYSLDDWDTWNYASASDVFNSTNENYTFTTSALANWSWTVIVRATDSVWHTTTSYASDSFIVDNTTPVIKNLNVTVNSSSSISVAGLATNPWPTSITGAEYYFDNSETSSSLSLWAGTTSRNYNGDISIASLSVWTHTIYVRAKNEANTRSTYTSQSFTKAAAWDSTAPTLSSASATPAKTTADIAFTSNEAGTAKIAYWLSSSYSNTTQYSSMIAWSNTISLAWLTCNTTYHYTIYGKDAVGNENNNLWDSTFTTTACDSALEITSLYLSNLWATSAIINYTTDTGADTKFYRYSQTAYTWTWTTLPNSSVTISSLTMGKTYYYQVKFIKNGQTTTSNPISFKTASANNGIMVNSITRILNGNTPTAWGDYTSGYHFRFNITVNDIYKDTLNFKLADRSNSASTMAVANNTKIVVSGNGVSTDTEWTVNTTDILTGADIYSKDMDIYNMDSDSNLWGSQIMLDMFYKIPTGSQWIFSTSYGIQALNTDT